MAIEKIFYPESVAIIGASGNKEKAGYQIAYNMLREDLNIPVYFINLKEREILGKEVFPTLIDIPFRVDMIVITIPAKGVPEVMRQAKSRGDVRTAVILSSGFSETGIEENIALEKEVLNIAHKANIRIIGPNCVGVINTQNRLNTTFAASLKLNRGGMSLISQSGSIGASLLSFIGDQPVAMGFSKWIHVGNMTDVSIEEVLQYFGSDTETKVISLYIEGLNNARIFFDQAKKISLSKPIVALKVGRSTLGAKAASSHTGALAGTENLYEGAFEQTSIIRVETLEELLDTSKAFAFESIPNGNRIAVITEAGGAGVIAMDVIGKNEKIAELAEFSKDTISELRRVLPPMALISNPNGYVDMTAAANEEQHAKALEIVLNDKNVDAVLMLSVPPTFLEPQAIASGLLEMKPLSDKLRKPVFVCLMAGEWLQKPRIALEKAGIPTFDLPERAAQALVNTIKWLGYKKRNTYLEEREK